VGSLQRVNRIYESRHNVAIATVTAHHESRHKVAIALPQITRAGFKPQSLLLQAFQWRLTSK
jgi:hypothetical protein